MTYVLVHLRGDQPTEDATRLVEHVIQSRTAVAVLSGPSPPHDDVVAALTTISAPPSGVCVGHGRAAGIGPDRAQIWADAEQLGALFRDRRLYAYACDTAGGTASLGARAVETGIAVFVGHEGPIETTLPHTERRIVAEVAAAAILAFIDGHDDETTLRNAIHDAGDALLEDEPPIAYISRTNRVPNFWTQSELFDQLAFSLRVHRRDSERVAPV